MAERKNIVSRPPLQTPMLNPNGTPSRAWAVWFRDMFDRTSNKNGNSIDDNEEAIDGTLDTLDEVIVVVLDHEERIIVNEADIEQNKQDIQTNKDDIATNKQNILDLEYRVFGSNSPAAYDEEAAYSAGNYIVNPSGDPQSYYRAINDISAPAGVFNPSLWKKVSLIDNDAYIELTRAQAKAAFVAAGYGGIGVDASNAIGTINSTFQTIEGFDIDLIATPLDVTYDKSNHGLKLDRQGVWEFSIKVTLTFDEVNAGRQIQLRAYNDTTSTPSATTFNYFVGRNQAGVNLQLTFAVEVAEGDEGQLIQLEVGSATDTFTNSTNIGTIYQVKHISERKEDLGA
ncbi:hypothetical protein BA3_0008 [Thalassomonas phage BA3]|uniref:hypothetical protein n=1 Tax=Thalassomonas phage BA3 TaxID=469660 RepID=UPI00015D958D|nr:hypothetical protein BA3_0008 [Thalassomonas phage BA3]ABV74293.1 hypothetical protein BA3_0008 [Thalassomonas phage BA3]